MRNRQYSIEGVGDEEIEKFLIMIDHTKGTWAYIYILWNDGYDRPQNGFQGEGREGEREGFFLSPESVFPPLSPPPPPYLTLV